MNLKSSYLNKFGSMVFAVTAIGAPALASAAGSVESDSLNGFYVTLGPNIQHTKVDKTTSLGNGAKQFLEDRKTGKFQEIGGGLQPGDAPPTNTQPISSNESKTGVLPQLTLGYMHPLWGSLSQVSLGVEAFYAPKAGSSNIVSTTYGASGLLAYNFATLTQVYLKGSYVDMKANFTGSQQFYRWLSPSFGPAGSAIYQAGDTGYVDPNFKIDQRLNGAGVALGARQLLPFNVLGGQHLFAGGEVSYTKFSINKTIASPEYHNGNFNGGGGGAPLNGSITNTKLSSAKQSGVNLYVGYRF